MHGGIVDRDGYFEFVHLFTASLTTHVGHQTQQKNFFPPFALSVCFVVPCSLLPFTFYLSLSSNTAAVTAE